MRRPIRDKRRENDPVTVKELEEEIAELKVSLKAEALEAAKKQFDESLKVYKVSLLAFFAGFAVFVTIGLLTRGQLFESVARSLYPPASIHNDIKPQLSTTVWSTMNSGTTQDYERFISRAEFYEALRTYHTDLVRTFLLPTREKSIRASEVMRAGKTPLDATILMVGQEYDGKPTARCHQQFSDQESQAIVVIPKSSDAGEFGWFDCAFGWPSITLSIKVGDKQINDLRLVGVRRNGGTERLQVLLSKEAAKRLDLPGWQDYKAHSLGRVHVASAE